MMLEEGKDYRDVAKLLKVPSKNVKRWLNKKKRLILYLIINIFIF